MPAASGLAVTISPTVVAGSSAIAGDHLAVLAVTAPDRASAVAAAATALLDLRCDGPADNRVALLRMLRDAGWAAGQVVPTLAVTANVFGDAVDLGDEITEAGTCLRIERPGIQTTVQDSAGRQGYWEIGVPPSGPMDDLSLRLANEAVGNQEDLAGLEITLGGFVAVATQPCTIAVAGAPSAATVDGRPIQFYEPIALAAGGKIEIPPPRAGLRIYLAVRGGIDTSVYLGSRATFTLGGFGGFRGRELQRGDVLPIGETKTKNQVAPSPNSAGRRLVRIGKSGYAWGRTPIPIISPVRASKIFLGNLESISSVQSHGCAPAGPQATVGPPGRRRSRAASVKSA